MISFLKFLQGYLYVCLSGPRLEQFLTLCGRRHILIWNLTSREDNYYCCISRKSMPLVKEVLEKTGTRITIEKKCGLPFFLYRHRKRKIFAICCVFAGIMLYGMSFFLWDISIIGNESYKKSDIMNYVTKNYVHGGQLISEIDTLKLEEELRTHFSKFAWVSCEIKGTQLTIHIKETIPLNTKNTQKEPCDLCSNKAGKIISVITREGTPVVKAGDEVKTGDILISGTISYKNDAGEEYEQDYVAADGDTVIETYYDYEDTIATRFYKKQYTGEEKAGYKLYFFGQNYNIYKPKITEEKVGVTHQKYQFKLGKTFYFPISVQKTRYRFFGLKQVQLTKTQAKELINQRFQAYCEKLTKKGVEIVGNNVKISMSGENLTAKGKIKVYESVGKISLIDTSKKKENLNEHSGETD